MLSICYPPGPVRKRARTLRMKARVMNVGEDGTFILTLAISIDSLKALSKGCS